MRLGAPQGAAVQEGNITPGAILARTLAVRTTVVAPAVAGSADILTIPAGTLTATGMGVWLVFGGVNLAGNAKAYAVDLAKSGGAVLQAALIVGNIPVADVYQCSLLLLRGTTNLRGIWVGQSFPSNPGSFPEINANAIQDQVIPFAGADTWDNTAVALRLHDTLGAGQLNCRGALLFKIPQPAVLV